MTTTEKKPPGIGQSRCATKSVDKLFYAFILIAVE
jgi:hypothetical protein